MAINMTGGSNTKKANNEGSSKAEKSRNEGSFKGFLVKVAECELEGAKKELSVTEHEYRTVFV
jgi:hypothetical protein